jgi:choline-sulfatase/uncharacterized sulfatase
MFPAEYPHGFGELYDLEDDPWEMNNLYFEPQYAHMTQELREDLMDWLITTTRVVTALGSQPQGNQTITRCKNTINWDGKFAPERWRPSQNYL